MTEFKVFSMAEMRRDKQREERRKKRPQPPGPDDRRPVIKLVAGQMKRAVDASEAALITRGGLFQEPTGSSTLAKRRSSPTMING